LAYYANNELDENEDELQEGGPQQVGPSGSTVIGADSGAQAAGPKASATPSPDNPGNFVGIKDYLNANKPQAEKLGSQASSVIDNSANDARSSLSSLNDTFNQQAGTAISADPNAMAKINEAEKLNAQEKEQLKKQYSAQYQGPNSLQDLGDQYNDAGKKLTTAKTNVESSGTEQGRQGLITQINSKPRTAGITNFDSALLQSGSGREKVADAANRNKDVTGDLLGQTNLAAQQKASDLKSQNDAVRNQTQSAIGGATDSFSQALSKKVQDALSKTVNQNNAIAQDITDLNLDESTMGAYGLNSGDRTYGLNLADYYTPGDVNGINNANIADQTDYARYLALSQIAGIDPATLNLGDASKAGTAPTIRFNADGFNSDRAAKQKSYENFYNNQKGGVLAPSDISAVDTAMNVFTGGGASGNYITSVLSGIQNATPKQLEQSYIPNIKSLAEKYPRAGVNFSDLAKSIESRLKSLQKDKYKINTAVKKNK
jgi:hypothetical protein